MKQKFLFPYSTSSSRKIMIEILILTLLSSILFIPAASALKTFGGDFVTIDEPIDDDVFASGGTINIDAPISGGIITGGDINVNAPVENDLIAAGGQIYINSDIGGKIVVAGGNVNVKGNISTNAVIAAGNVQIHRSSIIGKDAEIAGGNVVNEGKIIGNLTVKSDSFENRGTAGQIIHEKSEFDSKSFVKGIKDFFRISALIMAVGLLIVGILFVRTFPAPFITVADEVRNSPLRDTAFGFVMMIASVIVLFILTISVIGFPLALLLGLGFVIALMLSTLFVSYGLGSKIFSLLGKQNTSNIATLVVGFIILQLLFNIPYVGWLTVLIAVSLGFGGILYSLNRNWDKLTGKENV